MAVFRVFTHGEPIEVRAEMVKEKANGPAGVLANGSFEFYSGDAEDPADLVAVFRREAVLGFVKAAEEG